MGHVFYTSLTGYTSALLVSLVGANKDWALETWRLWVDRPVPSNAVWNAGCHC